MAGQTVLGTRQKQQLIIPIITNKESHSNPFGQGDWVLKDLKRDFDMPARQSIALTAVHGLPPTKHNKQLQTQYRWAGNPFISNNYIRTLAWGLAWHFHQGMAENKDIILELNGSDDILTFQTIQGNGYKDGNLFEGPKSSWLGYSLLPEGISYQIISTSKIPLYLDWQIEQFSPSGKKVLSKILVCVKQLTSSLFHIQWCFSEMLISLVRIFHWIPSSVHWESWIPHQALPTFTICGWLQITWNQLLITHNHFALRFTFWTNNEIGKSYLISTGSCT